jgi:hypothetical protein
MSSNSDLEHDKLSLDIQKNIVSTYPHALSTMKYKIEYVMVQIENDNKNIDLKLTLSNLIKKKEELEIIFKKLKEDLKLSEQSINNKYTEQLLDLGDSKNNNNNQKMTVGARTRTEETLERAANATADAIKFVQEAGDMVAEERKKGADMVAEERKKRADERLKTVRLMKIKGIQDDIIIEVMNLDEQEKAHLLSQ